MADRPVFVPSKRRIEADVYMTEFQWNSGMAVSQKQKNITALHQAFTQKYPERKVLEISSKSLQPLGVKLSAFHLTKMVPALGKAVPLECVFQGGKVFAAGGPYVDLYEASARDAKRDERLRSSGRLKHFSFQGETIPTTPDTACYNWLYVNALLEHPDLAQELLDYDAFTDIEFNPDKSRNCQAEAAAVFVFLGYYPLIKPKLEKLPLPWLWKFLFFNAAILMMYTMLIYLFGVEQLAAEYAEMGAILLIATLLLGNLTFFLLDKLLSKRWRRKFRS